MKKKIVIPVVLTLVLALVFSGQVYAAASKQVNRESPESRVLRLSGVVVSVDIGNSTLVVKPRRGAELTVTADDKTRFAGAAASLEEIEPGMQAVIAAHREQGGMVRLVGIFTRVPLERFRGQVEAVDPGAGSLTLTTRQGDSVTFLMDENTRYKGYKMTVESLEDVQPGMWAGIVAARMEDGSLVVRNLLAAAVEDLPKPQLNMAGKVVGVSDNSFTIENRAGEEITFMVDENTRFRSRDGNVTTLNQLKEGMGVLVGAQALENGELLAKGVLVVQRKP